MTNIGNGEKIPSRRSALRGVLRVGKFGRIGINGPSIFLSERSPLSVVQLELTKNQPHSILEGVAKCLRTNFPQSPNLSTGENLIRILWSGPNRWLIIEPEARNLLLTVENIIGSETAALTDLSHGKTAIRIKGRATRELLMKGSGLDWHTDIFKPNNCAQTKLFTLAIQVDCRDFDTFDLYIARGFAQDLLTILLEASEEFGCEVQ